MEKNDYIGILPNYSSTSIPQGK